MSNRKQIEAAFWARKRPADVVRLQTPVTTEQSDAAWFIGRDRESITLGDWEERYDALYAFAPEAFLYFLPSVLSYSVEHPDRRLLAADVLIGLLDRSPTPEYWNSFLTERLCGLRPIEYDALKLWILELAKHGAAASAESLGRAFDTLNLLQADAAQRSDVGF